jgi:hypothetical protein
MDAHGDHRGPLAVRRLEPPLEAEVGDDARNDDAALLPRGVEELRPREVWPR